MTKRIDTGSPWPLSNNPRGQYFAARPNGVIGDGDYPLWQVVRASTAAPAYFDSQPITIARAAGSKSVTGEFVDGGVSPFNNPALLAMMYATMIGYRINWPTGADKLLVVSIGTGAADPTVTHASLAAKQAVDALLSLMNDTATLQETLLQWLSDGPTARRINREVGDLEGDVLNGTAALTYRRYNVDLRASSVQELEPALQDPKVIESLSAMDSPANMTVLHRLGMLAAQRDIKRRAFPGGIRPRIVKSSPATCRRQRSSRRYQDAGAYTDCYTTEDRRARLARRVRRSLLHDVRVQARTLPAEVARLQTFD